MRILAQALNKRNHHSTRLVLCYNIAEIINLITHMGNIESGHIPEVAEIVESGSELSRAQQYLADAQALLREAVATGSKDSVQEALSFIADAKTDLEAASKKFSDAVNADIQPAEQENLVSIDGLPPEAKEALLGIIKKYGSSIVDEQHIRNRAVTLFEVNKEDMSEEELARFFQRVFTAEFSAPRKKVHPGWFGKHHKR